ncbi:parallel beta-helix domain-containing protein [Erythrobacter sp.]|uniref:parallel beta-helix domain-containing protein n=1 Tax=Erythrobacter sp. TaxID=1042 RepID=UPI001B211371|nr:parallel beta-helix domain-containing protein [Erythrobacter sp.]MBO6528209.1 right-handed parallel beta-helix repeat-containing protein [Erythrobacter sp.]MBO6528825.1 right-handed parallel beta-helix repeat-containing protein [Erythrobacter sp.]
MTRLSIAAVLLATAAPALATTHNIAPGENAQQELQEALILAEPGDEIVLAAGRYVLTDGLSLDVDGVTVRGEGMDGTILDFTTQAGSGEGMLVTSDDVTLRDFALENPKGDGIKSKGADNIVYHRLRVTWTRGPHPENGAYGIYPVESTGVLVDGVKVTGASDAGIYVGQSNRITVRNSIAEANVAGIEIENSRNALVEHNIATRNTGGILVFDLPDLPVMGGGNVVVANNLVVANDTPNFAPPGNIVAGVRRGTGIMVMANDNVLVEDNILSGNPTAPIMVIAYTQSFEDERYNPFPREVVVGENIYDGGGYDPQLDGADTLLAAFGGELPPVMWDGLGSLAVVEGTAGWSLNLTEQGVGLEGAQPSPLAVSAPSGDFDRSGIGAPAALDERLGG